MFMFINFGISWLQLLVNHEIVVLKQNHLKIKKKSLQTSINTDFDL